MFNSFAEISANHSGSLNLLKETMQKQNFWADAEIQAGKPMTLNAKNKHFFIDDNLYGKENIYLIYTKSRNTI